MASIAVGIDLGTSNSCVAVAQRGRVDVLPNAFGESTTASVVNIGADGSITVGNAAKANIIHDPLNTIYSSKRLIGRYFFSDEVKKAQAICSYEIVEGEGQSVRIKVREEVFSLPEIGAMILRELKSIAESRLGKPAAQAVLTVPAYFNDSQRQATKDAARIAGIEVLRVLNEPTAAALAYGFGRGLNQRVAVYDLGGGTFDISVLEIGEDVFEVLATAGDTFLGGDDFDDRMIDFLADEFMQREGLNLRNDPFALEKLKVAAEDAKKALSLEPEVEIRIPDVIAGPDGAPRSIERTLTTAEFGALVSDLLQRSFKVCDEALQQAGVVAQDLDGVILVGGPTRLPVIREAVRDYFQQEPLTDVDPDEVVAMGAAIHAASLVSEETDSFLLDVTPLSLQIGVAGGLTEKVIERNTPVPIEQTRTFTTFKDHQRSVAIRVYQGESREASENELLGQFEFSGFETGRRGEVEIDVGFEIDTDGIVSVTAKDRKTGQQASTRITLSSGLSDGEMSAILERGVTDRVETSPAVADRAARAATARTTTGDATHPEPVRAVATQDPATEPDDLFDALLEDDALATSPSAPDAAGAAPSPAVASGSGPETHEALLPDDDLELVPLSDDDLALETGLEDSFFENGERDLTASVADLAPSAPETPGVLDPDEAVTGVALGGEPPAPAPTPSAAHDDALELVDDTDDGLDLDLEDLAVDEDLELTGEDVDELFETGGAELTDESEGRA